MMPMLSLEVRQKVASAFGAKLREVRARLGLSQTELSRITGMEQRLLSQLETDRRPPSEKNWADLSKAFQGEDLAELKRARAIDLVEREGLSDAAAVVAEPSPDDVDPEALLRQALFRTADGATVTEGDVEEIVGLWKARIQRKTRNERRET